VRLGGRSHGANVDRARSNFRRSRFHSIFQRRMSVCSRCRCGPWRACAGALHEILKDRLADAAVSIDASGFLPLLGEAS
jgi:hypothetical protein